LVSNPGQIQRFGPRDAPSPDGVNLAAETVVGLPRSNLVKPLLPSPPAAFVPVPAPVEASSARDPFRTNADSVEVEIESQRAPETQRDAVSAFTGSEPVRGPYASSPSATELLERAAAMGPARMTWESIVLVSDPILSEKRQPHVAERRERLTRVVKMTLGACVAVCALALGVSALSGDASAKTTAAATSLGKTVASKGIVPVERLDGTKHGKAARRVAPAVTTAAIVRPKHR
jgi:hypothetical protein